MQSPDLVAGAAVIASNHPAPENVLPEMAALDRQQPVRMLLITGTEDPIVPFAGGVASLWGAQPRGPVLSSVATAALFAERNGITTAPTTEHVTGGQMPTTLTAGAKRGTRRSTSTPSRAAATRSRTGTTRRR